MLLGYLKVDICRGLFSEAVTPWLMTVRSVKMKSWGWSGKGASAVLESSAKAVTATGESACGWGWGWWDEAALPRGCLVYIDSEPTWVHVFGDCPAACDLQGGRFTLRAKTVSSRSLSQRLFLLYHRWVGRIDPQIQKKQCPRVLRKGAADTHKWRTELLFLFRDKRLGPHVWKKTGVGRAACSVRVGMGRDLGTAAIAVTEVWAMAPASVKHGVGKKDLVKSCAGNREVISLICVVVTLKGQSLGVCCIES